MKDTQITPRDYEKRVLDVMLRLYCRGRHHSQKFNESKTLNGSKNLCSDCQSLKVYCFERIDNCTLKEDKVSCRRCHIHCYTPQRREQIRQVMRYSGPRMLFHHPLMAIRHILKELREKKPLQ